MTTDLYNLNNEKVGTTELDEGIFNAPWKPDLVFQVVRAQLANARRPWAHAKGRGEVRGGGKKPWRQKGTGRARHGSIRSPLWVHGGKAHGPQKERDYFQKINKKMKRLAIFSVLSKKNKDGEIKIFDTLEIPNPKTKILNNMLRPILGVQKENKKLNLLLIPSIENKNINRAARNLVKTKVLNPKSLNAYDLMNYKNIFIDQKSLVIIKDSYKIKS